MKNINKNVAINTLLDLIIKEGQKPYTISKKRAHLVKEESNYKKIVLEKTIDEAISFNRKLNWDNSDKNLGLATTAEKLIEVYKLRSEVYGRMNYSDEFPDFIKSLNFDSYDYNSAIIYNMTNNVLTGTCRLIFDSEKKLPIDEKYSLDIIRNKFINICEVSRVVSKYYNEGLSMDFKHLTKGVYLVLSNNNIDASVSVMTHEHYKLYTKFGGFRIEDEMEKYGNIKSPFVITSWNTSKITPFFKKIFLR